MEEPEDGADPEAMEKCGVLLSKRAQPASLIEPRTTRPRKEGPTHNGLAPPPQPQTSKRSTGLLTVPSSESIFVLSFPPLR